MDASIIDKFLEPYKQQIQELKQTIQQLQEKKYQHRSTQINELATALANAQRDINVVHASKKNRYYRTPYADLKSIIRAIHQSFPSHGLAFEQKIIDDETGSRYLFTILMHETGQWSSSQHRLTPPKNDIDTYKSYIAVMRRIALCSHLGIATDDEDDDGYLCMQDELIELEKGISIDGSYEPEDESVEVINKQQLEELEYTLKEWPDVAKNLLKSLRIRSLSDVPKSRYRWVIEKAREIIRMREE